MRVVLKNDGRLSPEFVFPARFEQVAEFVWKKIAMIFQLIIAVVSAAVVALVLYGLLMGYDNLGEVLKSLCS